MLPHTVTEKGWCKNSADNVTNDEHRIQSKQTFITGSRRRNPPRAHFGKICVFARFSCFHRVGKNAARGLLKMLRQSHPTSAERRARCVGSSWSKRKNEKRKARTWQALKLKKKLLEKRKHVARPKRLAVGSSGTPFSRRSRMYGTQNAGRACRLCARRAVPRSGTGQGQFGECKPCRFKKKKKKEHANE